VRTGLNNKIGWAVTDRNVATASGYPPYIRTKEVPLEQAKAIARVLSDRSGLASRDSRCRGPATKKPGSPTSHFAGHTVVPPIAA
jgi:hypothetical protein